MISILFSQNHAHRFCPEIHRKPSINWRVSVKIKTYRWKLKLYYQWFYDLIVFRVTWIITVKFGTYSAAVKVHERHSLCEENLWRQPTLHMQKIYLILKSLWCVSFIIVSSLVFFSKVLCLFYEALFLRIITKLVTLWCLHILHLSALFFAILTNLDWIFVQ